VRVAVVDIGTNSTRLLVADVDGAGKLSELDRRTTVTRLGQGVDKTGELADAAMERVFATLVGYRERIDALGAQRAVAVLTSAVRDAGNGAAFAARVRDGFGLDARTIPGREEARLTFLGATSERPPGDAAPRVVIDIGGGSTEFIAGAGHAMTFHVSTQAGVVRQTERHIASDPPAASELAALAADVRATFEAAIPADVRARTRAAIAVAGTATSLAAIHQDLEPFDPKKVHGYRMSIGACDEILGRLAALTEEQRRAVRGLQPDRAPTIIAGVVMLIEALRVFDLVSTEISEHDILRGTALEVVHRAARDGAWDRAG
jgi:exopolyphosphatase / guanosine-5'-triphosphate,3'-diphosphate pyrophosphatase